MKYSYTWSEEKAREGYIRHDIHKDDVPIEVITTNSSEAGAESSFADEYSKDITINDNVSVDDFENGNTDEGDEEEISDFTMNEENHKSVFRLYKGNIATASNIEVEEDHGFFANTKNVLTSYVMDTLQFFSPKSDDEDKKEEVKETKADDEEKENLATPSDAKPTRTDSNNEAEPTDTTNDYGR